MIVWYNVVTHYAEWDIYATYTKTIVSRDFILNTCVQSIKDYHPGQYRNTTYAPENLFYNQNY